MAVESKSRRRERKSIERKRHARRSRNMRAIGLIVFVIVALVALAVYRQSTVPNPGELSGLASGNIAGNPDAPVSLVEFGDFGCPACRAWHNAGIHDEIVERYGGQVSFTFRHFPVITRQSPKAAEAAQCAEDQGAFWLYHDFLYEQATDLRPEALKGYAAALGLDAVAFNACLDSDRHANYVNEDLQAAFSAGAMGTPTFFLNGDAVSFQSEALFAAIEAALP